MAIAKTRSSRGLRRSSCNNRFFFLAVLLLAVTPFFYGWVLIRTQNDGPIEHAEREKALVKGAHKLSDENRSIGCLTDECIQKVASRIARSFPLRHDKSSWCHAKEDKNHFMGILLTKVPKGASSTSAGVALRIANRHQCANLQWQHRMASEYMANNKYQRDKSFLFTTVRDPGVRAISTLFFHVVSRSPPVEAAILDSFLVQQLQTSTQDHYGAVSKGQGGFQLRYISLNTIPEHSAWHQDSPETVLHAEAVVENVRQAIASYDFILVPERMDESLVAMALILDIDVGDVLVTASKVAGSRFHLLRSNRKAYECTPTVKSFVGKKVGEFLASAQWRAMNYGDYLLHEAANQSLDLTIAAVGRERFEVALERFRELRRLEQEQCAASVAFPCSNDGKPQIDLAAQNCYLRDFDFGCGYPCIDSMIERYDSNKAMTR